MADPITNAQYASSLFSGLPALVQRRGDQQTTLALQGLRRQQQLDDQAATFEEQKNLTSLQTDRYLKVEDERTRRAHEREDAQTARATEREARRAYAAYATLAADAGETPKPFESFGKDPEDAVTAISEAMSVLQGKQNDAAFAGLTASYRRKRDDVKTMLVPSADEIKGLTQQVLGKMMPTDTKEENWGKALAAIAGGSEGVGLNLMGPQDRAAFMGARSQGLMALRALRTKDPAYVSAAREVGTMQEAMVNAGFKNPKWARMIGQIDAGGPGDATSGGTVGLDDFLNAASKSKTPPPAKSVPAPGAAIQPDPNSYGGLLGLLNFGRRAASSASPSLVQANTDFIKYAPGTFAQVLGGERLVRDAGLDRADEQILRLRDAYARRPWIRSTGDAILRSLFRPDPLPGQ